MFALGVALLAATGLSAARTAEHTLPLLTPADSLQQGFVRIINHSPHAGSVRIHGTDDTGQRFGPVTLDVEARATRHFDSGDLEQGNTAKGLSAGLGDGEGSWRLRLETDLDIEPAAYLHTPDGYLTSVHDVAPATEVEGKLQHRVPIFNPGSNRDQVSWLRLANLSDSSVEVTIRGRDDAGDSPPGGEVRLTLPAGAARRISALQLESGGDGLSGQFGDGEGKWRLFVEADGDIEVVSLLRAPTGHLTNLSAPNRPPAEKLHAVGSVFRDCAECPEMVVVPAGSFLMGSPEDEVNRDADEGPMHRVTIGEPFAVGVYEVTFAEWDACHADGGCSRRPDDQGWGRGDRPVVDVSWNDAQEYVRWLSGETGRRYRLPSEAEWEYAARAGTTTRYWWGDDIGENRANCDGCGSAWDARQTAPVGSFPANAFGLHDVHGNVWEQVQDCRNESYAGAPSDGTAWELGDCSLRMGRGGSGQVHPRRMRSAYRAMAFSSDTHAWAGFRVALAVSARHTLPLFRAAGRSQQSIARIINRSSRAGTVQVYGTDDIGQRRGPVTLELEPNETRHFSSRDLEDGNAELSDGLGDGVGDWRLELVSGLDIEPSAYIRTTDGFLTAMHDAAVRAVDPDGTTVHRVPFFNPGSNLHQVSWLRVANLTDGSVDVTIRGIDDAGQAAPGGDVVLTLPARAARRVSARQLESGLSSLSGRLGDGTGRWRLLVTADGDIEVVSLLRSPTGHLSNLSASGLVDELEIATAGPHHVEPLKRVALQVLGGLTSKSDYTVLIDVAGGGTFEEGNVIEVPGFTTDGDEVLFAAPMPQVLSHETGGVETEPRQCDASLICAQVLTCVDGLEYPTACGPDNCDEPIGTCPWVETQSPQFSVRLRRELDGRLSNVLHFSVEDVRLPADLAGYPITILEGLLEYAFTYSDDESLNNELNDFPPPGQLVDIAERLGLDTSFTDALSEALLGRLFGVSVLAAFEELEEERIEEEFGAITLPPSLYCALFSGADAMEPAPEECEPVGAGTALSQAAPVKVGAAQAAPADAPPSAAGGSLSAPSKYMKSLLQCLDRAIEQERFKDCLRENPPHDLVNSFVEAEKEINEIGSLVNRAGNFWQKAGGYFLDKLEGWVEDAVVNHLVGSALKLTVSEFRSDSPIARDCAWDYCSDADGALHPSRHAAKKNYESLRDLSEKTTFDQDDWEAWEDVAEQFLAENGGTRDQRDALSELETIAEDQARDFREIEDAGESYFLGEDGTNDLEDENEDPGTNDPRDENEDPGTNDPTDGSKVCTVRGDTSRFAELVSEGSVCPNDVVFTAVSLDLVISFHRTAGYLLLGETETWRLAMRDYGYPPIGRAAGWDCELLVESAYDNAYYGLPSPSEFTFVHICPYGDDDTEPFCESICACPDPEPSGHTLCQYQVAPPPANDYWDDTTTTD